MRTFGWLRTARERAFAAALATTAIVFLTGCPRHRCQVDSTALTADPTGNGVFDPGETVSIEPTWLYHSVRGGAADCLSTNPCSPTALLALSASDFNGPAGADYAIVQAAANYGDIPLGSSRSCTATGTCYQLSVSAPAERPAAHWDATLTESSPGSSPLDWLRPLSAFPMAPEACATTYHTPRTWTLHIGASFSDVFASSGFYPYIENLFHNGITAGCGNGNYCPDDSIRRDQMAVFLVKARFGSSYAPIPCRGRFVDVPCPGLYTDWVEQASVMEGFIEACGRRSFCPEDPVKRSDIAAWLLKAFQGSDYLPPAATGLFLDVPIDDPQAAWIEDLYNRQITAGCSAEPRLFCPDGLNTRAQMAVLVDKTFGLRLY